MHRNLPTAAAILTLVLLGSACAGSTQEGDSGRAEGLELTTTGVGRHDIGAPFEDVRDDIAARFGGWDVDSFEPNHGVHVPDCGGPETRLLAWGNFIVLFTGPAEDLRLATWTYGFNPLTGSPEDVRGLNLTTNRGVGLGATTDEIKDAHGSDVHFQDAPELDSVLVTIGSRNGDHMSGRLEPDLIVLELEPTCE